MTPISWKHLSDVIDYHTSLHAQYIDTPWVVPPFVNNVTYQGKDFNALSTSLSLVGSAEQGFIYLHLQDALEPNKLYISCTPCFRNEEEIDDLHRHYFMKAELFMPVPVESFAFVDRYAYPKLSFVCKTAKQCLETLFQVSLDLVNIDENSFDLNLNGIEIGSYYSRKYTVDKKEIAYVCGTAIAEPRFSVAMNTKRTE